MRNWEAYELHCVNAEHNKFYRIMRSGSTVVIRFGRRGGAGQRQVKSFLDGCDAAAMFVYEQRNDKTYSRDYDYVYEDTGNLAVPDPKPGPLPTTPDDIEAHCLARWKETATRGISGTPVLWGVFSDLLTLSQTDPTSRFVLEELETGRHAIDKMRDLVLGTVHRPEMVNEIKSGVCFLDFVEDSDDTETLKATLGLYNPGTETPGSLMRTARTLTRVSQEKVHA